MNSIKRIMSIIFIFAMLLGSAAVPHTAVHADDSGNSESIKLMSALGIMQTDENTGMFWDNTPVERREMAVILCNMLRLEPSNDTSPRFIDVPENGRAYIETVVRYGYMSGYSDNRFVPTECITGEQLAKIFVTLIGGESPASALGGFPQGYVEIARKFGLMRNYSSDLSSAAKRIDVANIISAALDADMMTVASISADGEKYHIEKGTTFLTEVMNIYRYEGIVNRNAFTSLDSPDGTDESSVRIGDKRCYDTRHIAENYLGYNVTVYVHIPHKGDIGDVVYVNTDNNKTVVADAKDFIGVDGTRATYRDENRIKTLEMSYVCDMIYNGKAAEYDADKFNIKNGNIKFIDNNKDGLYDVVIINNYIVRVAEKGNAENEIISLKYGEKPLKLCDYTYRIYRSKEEIDIDDIASGEVLFAAVSDAVGGKGAAVIYVTDERVIGAAETVGKNSDGETTARISGREYCLSDYCEGLMDSGYLNRIRPGDSGQFFVGSNGEIVYFDVSANKQKVGYMINSSIDTNPFGGNIMLKIYTEQSDIIVLKSADTIRLNGKKIEVASISEELLDGGQLIEYAEKDGTLTELNVAVNGVDNDNFSLDFSGSLKCVSKSVLGYKYLATAETKVFRVPFVSEDEEHFDETINNSALYQNLSGTYFNGGTTYTVKLYDFNEYNEAKYAVVTYNPYGSDIWYNYPMLLITDVYEGVDGDNEAVMLKGLNEKGEEESLVCANREVLKDSSIKREPVVGDVLQYRKGVDGKIAQIIIQHSSTQSEYYMPKSLDGAIDGIHVTKTYGKVIRNNGINVLISCGGEAEFDFVARNVNGVVYKYNKDRGAIAKIDFSDIEPEDNVFVCCNYSGLRMIVVNK